MHAQAEAPCDILAHDELDLVAVVPLLGARDALANELLCALDLAGAGQGVDDGAALEVELLLVGDLCPRAAAAAAGAGLVAAGLDAVLGSLDDLVDRALRKAVLGLLDVDEDLVAGTAHGDEHRAAVGEMRDTVAAVGQRLDRHFLADHVCSLW